MAFVLFEDEHLLVVNKPAGWNTHSPSPFAGEGLYEWLRNREPRWAKLAIIHRLDKETSGVIVFGKTTEANRSLTQQFTARAVRKNYLLLTDRSVPEKRVIAVSALVRVGERYVSRPLHNGGERAETRFSVMEKSSGLALVQAEPITGRTHQIRVHAEQNGFPILGDTLYRGTKAERVFLHAADLMLKHPATGESLKFCAPCDWNAGPPLSLPPGGRPGSDVRAAIIDDKLTNAFRVIHGSSDGSPGMYVDKLGDYLLAQTDHPITDCQREQLEVLARTYGSRGVCQKLLSRHVRRATTSEASPQLLLGESAPEQFGVRENGLTFALSFSEGYSVGLFLDQRENRRRWLANYVAPEFFISHATPQRTQSEEELRAFAPLREISVLNAFAYTCGFSVAAAKAGARTTSLDLSKKYLEWGKRNFALNGLDASKHDFIYGDAFDWMRRLAKKNRTFDCVVLDPPTFSQSRESGTWQAEKDFGKLVAGALPLLKPNGVLFVSTNAAKLGPEEFLASVEDSVTSSRRKIVQRHYAPQPPDFPISREEPGYLKTAWLRIS